MSQYPAPTAPNDAVVDRSQSPVDRREREAALTQPADDQRNGRCGLSSVAIRIGSVAVVEEDNGPRHRAADDAIRDHMRARRGRVPDSKRPTDGPVTLPTGDRG